MLGLKAVQAGEQSRAVWHRHEDVREEAKFHRCILSSRIIAREQGSKDPHYGTGQIQGWENLSAAGVTSDLEQVIWSVAAESPPRPCKLPKSIPIKHLLQILFFTAVIPLLALGASGSLSSPLPSRVLQDGDPPRKCAVSPPVSTACDGGIASCATGYGISNISCSTRTEGECYPNTVKCQYSCTLTINGSQGDLVCVGGASSSFSDCTTTPVVIPAGGTLTVSPPLKDVDCNDARHWNINWYNSAGNFICCVKVTLNCGKCL